MPELWLRYGVQAESRSKLFRHLDKNPDLSFRGSPDGSDPFSPVVFDKSGNLYGTTFVGGTFGQGTVFSLTPSDGEWTESILHSFASGEDGASPLAGVTVDQAGNLYGTTWEGGGALDRGTVFRLTPSGSLWTERILYRFRGTSDGGNVSARGDPWPVRESLRCHRFPWPS